VTVAAWALGVVYSGPSEAQGVDGLLEAEDLGAVEPAVGAEDAGSGAGDYDDEYAGAALPGPPWLIAAVELVVAAAVIAGCLTVVPERWQVPSAEHPGGVSLADRTYPSTWLHAIFASPSEGGLPEDSVIVSWWSASTLLWYGQRVERLRPDIYVVDDRTRLDDNLGEVWDVIDRFLGQRPVFVIRMTGGKDGMDVIRATYDLAERPLPDGSTVWQVISKKGMP
jgi:hypothetical protein